MSTIDSGGTAVARFSRDYLVSFQRAFATQRSALVVRHKRSDKLYSLEQDVFDANQREQRPYVYVWPYGRRKGSKPVWCYLDSLTIQK